MDEMTRQPGLVMRRSGVSTLLRGGGVLLSMSLAACAPQAVKVDTGAPAVTKSAESEVVARAEARWKVMMAHDFEAAYEFLSPGSKAVNTQKLFRAKILPRKWNVGSALGAVCQGDKCEVTMRIGFNDPTLGDVSTVYVETWILDGGKWWFVFNG